MPRILCTVFTFCSGGALLGQVTVSEFGATAPTIDTSVDTGYAGIANAEFSLDGGDTHGQTFQVPATGIVSKVYFAYRSFGNNDGDGLIDFTFRLDANNDGSYEVEQAFTGVDKNNFNTTTDTSWIEFDLSSLNISLDAGTTHSVWWISNQAGGQWVAAPKYSNTAVGSAPEAYADGSIRGSGGAGGGSRDALFVVKGEPPPDTDADSLPDPWELSFPGVTTLADLDGTLAAGSGPGSGTGDFDGDGLSDLDEYTNKTNPTLVDTDDDGINDGDEVSGARNPYTGLVLGTFPGDPTDPVDADSDDDNILDGEEVEEGSDTYVTNPNEADTDGDTLPDGWEVTYTLDPTDDGSTAVINGASGDPDEDTLDNEAEFFASTNPRNADTDEDGYDDNVEDSFGSWFDDAATGTNPLQADTDGDGLLDGQENPDIGTAGAAPYNSDPNLFDTDFDFYGDGDEVAAGTDPGSDLSVPTGIPMRNVGFTNTGGGWTATAGVALSTTEELLAGSGQYAVVDCNSAGRGVTVAHPNPSATVYCSVDIRIEGAMGTTAEAFNIMDGGATGAQSQAGTHCILRIFGNGSVQAFNGSTFLPVVPPGGIVDGTTYTAQIDHDVPNGLWAARVVDRQTGNVIGSITGVTVRPTSSPTADPLYFTVGSQSAQSAWDVAVDNMVVSLSAIDTGIIPPSAPLTVTSAGFNAGAFELTVSGFDTAKQYILRRSTDLMVFTDVGTAFTPAGATDTVSDPSPTGSKAFYRIEETP